jgi:hypothetical protein
VPSQVQGEQRLVLKRALEESVARSFRLAPQLRAAREVPPVMTTVLPFIGILPIGSDANQLRDRKTSYEIFRSDDQKRD